MMSNIPAGRAGNEKDIGALILFLAVSVSASRQPVCECPLTRFFFLQLLVAEQSKHQSYVSGSIIPIDGGMLNVVPSCY